MNLNYTELKQSCNTIKDSFTINEQWYQGRVQKIFSSGNYIILSVRVPGKTNYITIGRGNEDCGIWLASGQVPSPYRIVKDRMLEYFRSNFINKKLLSIRMDELDKCVEIRFSDDNLVLLFFKGRRLHFSHIKTESNKQIEYSPWKDVKKIECDYQDNFDVFQDAGRIDIAKEKKSRISNYIFPIEQMFKIDSGAIPQVNKKQTKKVERIENDLNRCLLWKEIQNELNTSELKLDEEKYVYKTFKVKFLRNESYHERRNKIFEKTKRLKRGEGILRDRLEKELLKLKITDTELINHKIVFPLWVKVSKKEKETEIRKEDAVFLTYGNIKIAIGLNAKGNDRLRKEWASKNDIWFHVEHERSSHLFVKGLESIDYHKAQVLGSMLAEYSKYNKTEIPIIYTKVSYLKGVKGHAGMVNYKKEKHLVIEQVNWKEIISTGW